MQYDSTAFNPLDAINLLDRASSLLDYVSDHHLDPPREVGEEWVLVEIAKDIDSVRHQLQAVLEDRKADKGLPPD